MNWIPDLSREKERYRVTDKYGSDFCIEFKQIKSRILADDHEMRDIDGVSRDGNVKGFSRR